MPLQEDRLLRLINLALAAIARAFGLKTAFQYQEAQEQINLALEALTGLRADLLHRLDYRAVVNNLTVGEVLDIDRLQMIAMLTKAQGDLHHSRGESAEARQSYFQALNFYLEVALDPDYQPINAAEAEPELPALEDEVAELLSHLNGVNLPQETRFSVFCYYDTVGQYANAAGILDALMADPALAESIRDEYRTFLTELGNKNDADLQSGGIDRAWVLSQQKTIG